MTLDIPLDLLRNADVMEAIGAAVDYLTALPEDQVTDELRQALARELDEAFPAATLIPQPAGAIVEAVDYHLFLGLLQLGESIHREATKPPKREGKGRPWRKLFRRKIEAGQP